MKNVYKKIVLSIIALLAAGISPNLFVISQAGYAQLSDLAVSFLLPSIAVLIIIFVLRALLITSIFSANVAYSLRTRR